MNLSKFFRFLLVGTLGFVCDYVILNLLIQLTACSPYIARIFSFLIAVFVTWQCNSRFTFLSSDLSFYMFLKYLTTNSLGFLFNLAIYTGLLALAGWTQGFALIMASASALLLNYLLNNKIVF